MAIKTPILVTTIVMKIMTTYSSIKEILKGAHYDTQLKKNAYPKNNPIDCDGVQLNNAQCHVVSISILWYRECWTMQLKCTFETKQDIIIISYHPTHQHGHTNVWIVCLLERVFFNYLDCSYNVWYVYKNGVYGPEARSSGGNTSSNLHWDLTRCNKSTTNS